MGRRGTKPAPNHIKLVQGTEERYLNRNEPVPSDRADIVPPKDLPEEAAAVWKRLAPDLVDKHVLTAWDVDQFAAYCVAVAQYNECRERMGDQYVVEGSMGQMVKSPYWTQMNEALQQMLRLSSRFGLTPADRAGLTIGADEPPKAGGERLLG